MTDRLPIIACLFSLEGSVCEQNNSFPVKTQRLLQEMHKIGILIGPVTDKNADYCHGIATGLGILPWHHVVAENGGHIVFCTNPDPPPVFDHVFTVGKYALEELDEFSREINLNPFTQTFKAYSPKDTVKKEYHYSKPELKTSMLTFSSHNTVIIKSWLAWFRLLLCQLNLSCLKVICHSDDHIDVVDKDVSRSNGIKALCARYNCQPEQILVVVNSEDDLELVTSGTTTIAVDNACDKIKKAVQNRGDFGYISKYPSSDGFFEGVGILAQRRYFINRSFELRSAIRKILEEISSASE